MNVFGAIGDFFGGLEKISKGQILHGTEAINAIPGLKDAGGALETVARLSGSRKGYGLKNALADTFLHDSKRMEYGDLLRKNKAPQEFIDSLSDDVLKQKVYDTSWGNLNKTKILGSGAGTMAGVSAASGLLHDSNGNTDIAGIPFI